MTVDYSKDYRGELQAQKLAQILEVGISETPDTTTVTVSEKDGSGLVTECAGNTAPTDGEAGYKKGCKFIDLNTVNGTNPEWINVGDESSCQFAQLVDTLGVDDDGAPMRNILRVASDVVSAQTVTIGADVYEVEIVNTDSTDDASNGDFNNTTNPLTVAGAVARYPNCPMAVGSLLRIQNEIMAVTANDGTDVTFKRAVSGTSAATHANGQNMIIGDGVTAGRIAVGLVTTLTPAVFTPALVADVNGRGTEHMKATSLQSGIEMLLESATAVGGTPTASATATACTETLAGSNNAWASATMFDGKVAGARKISVFNHTVNATEVALTAVRLSLPFNPVGFIVQAYDANGLFKGTLTDNITISGNRIEYDFASSPNLVATDKVTVFAWN